MNRESKRISRIASGEKLDYIREAIEKITEQRIIAAVTTMKSHEEVNRLLSMFSLFRRYVVNEKDSLDKTSKDFEKYATPNNKKFSTAYNMLSSIKSSIFSLYQLLNSNSKKPNCKYIYTEQSIHQLSVRPLRVWHHVFHARSVRTILRKPETTGERDQIIS